MFQTTRAVLFAAVCVGMALLGHLGAGGARPSAGVFAAAVVAVACAAAPLANRERSWRGITLALLSAQLGLHLLFHCTAPMPEPGPVLEFGAAHHSVPTGYSWGMLAAHAWAALVTGWWLAGGESALWAVLRWGWSVLLPPLVARPGIPARASSGARVPALASWLRLRGLRFLIDGRAPPLNRHAAGPEPAAA